MLIEIRRGLWSSSGVQGGEVQMLDAFLLMLLLQARFQSPSCAAGEGWIFILRGADLDKTPRWHNSTDAPPLAPRTAIGAARSLLRQMSGRRLRGAGEREVATSSDRERRPTSRFRVNTAALLRTNHELTCVRHVAQANQVCPPAGSSPNQEAVLSATRDSARLGSGVRQGPAFAN